jgi:membrane protein
VQALLEGAQNRAGGLLATVMGMITLLFGASTMLNELRDDLNTIWDVPVPQMSAGQEIASMLKGRLWSFALVLGIGCLLTILLLLNAGISALGKLYTYILPSYEAELHALNAAFSFVVITGLFGAIYKIVPEVEIEWRDVILGAAFTSLCFTVGDLLLGLYLGKTSFSSTYGAAASTVVLTLWVYYSSQVFFLGAEFTRAFSNRYGSCPRQNSVIEAGVTLAAPRTDPGTPLITPSR